MFGAFAYGSATVMALRQASPVWGVPRRRDGAGAVGRRQPDDVRCLHGLVRAECGRRVPPPGLGGPRYAASSWLDLCGLRRSPSSSRRSSCTSSMVSTSSSRAAGRSVRHAASRVVEVACLGDVRGQPGRRHLPGRRGLRLLAAPAALRSRSSGSPSASLFTVTSLYSTLDHAPPPRRRADPGRPTAPRQCHAVAVLPADGGVPRPSPSSATARYWSRSSSASPAPRR